ncbi:hypothetical protein A4A49_54826 [Nicotiana attenuata]|uniref:Uncharacterized protein n=1 Tax=Nicotiana attenuata TaxID=49451 RepID=A0A314KJC5_NICAT|nr:hypothetical protein A4A49_54826 [Nicotiana attenuata]
MAAATPACVLSPLFRLSPRHNGSDLYDSFELQAVAKQLNHALIKASTGSFSPKSSGVLKSPFYNKYLGGVYKQNAKASMRISCSQIRDEAVDNRADCRSTMNIFLRFWSVAKLGFLRSKQNPCRSNSYV